MSRCISKLCKGIQLSKKESTEYHKEKVWKGNKEWFLAGVGGENASYNGSSTGSSRWCELCWKIDARPDKKTNKLCHHQYDRGWWKRAETNVLTLQKLIEMTPQWMWSAIKAKGGPTKYQNVWLFFGTEKNNRVMVTLVGGEPTIFISSEITRLYGLTGKKSTSI